MRTFVHLPGEGEQIGLGSSSTVTIKATGKDTAGSFYLGEAVIEPGYAAPPPHIHERHHNIFYVLEGTLTLRIGDETLDLGRGLFACIPPGIVHTFSNSSEQPVRFLVFDTPAAGSENRLRDLAAAHAAGSLTLEEHVQISSRYDWRVA
jgi:uncharacterized cupin superfamily protein